MNWEELKAYFTSAELIQSQFDTKFKARLLKEMLSDHKNYLFFEFATPVVQEFERLNSLFQLTKADPHELYKLIFLHQKSLQNRPLVYFMFVWFLPFWLGCQKTEKKLS